MTKQDKKQPKQEQQQKSGQTSSQHGATPPGDENESPEMNQASEESGDKVQRGALDTQYGTDSATGSDRDTMSSPRGKGKQ